MKPSLIRVLLPEPATPGHHSQHLPGYLGVGFSDVVGSDLVCCIEAMRRHRWFIYHTWICQGSASCCAASQQRLIVPFKDDLSAFTACPWPHVDDMVRNGDELGVMIHDHYRIALVSQALKDFLDPSQVMGVQANAWLSCALGPAEWSQPDRHESFQAIPGGLPRSWRSSQLYSVRGSWLSAPWR